MATEIPHRYTLIACLYIGTKKDLTEGMEALHKLLPDHFVKDDKGWKVEGVTPELCEELKDIFIEDKVKLTERFELNLIHYLGWVMARRFTTLYLSCDEPAHNIKPQSWKWSQPKETQHEDSDDS